MAARYYFLKTGNVSSSCSHKRPDFYQELPENAFIKKFRLSKREVEILCNLLKTELSSVGSRSMDLSVDEKVMISLKTLASGSFQSSFNDLFNVSQLTVSKCLSAFVEALSKKASSFIYMPRSQAECNETKRGLYGIARFPEVLGCVDGTYIPIVAPSVDEPAYVNRKNFHSINVQAVCDPNLIFLDVVAQWTGSHHDSFIMNASTNCSQFDNDIMVMDGC